MKVTAGSSAAGRSVARILRASLLMVLLAVGPAHAQNTDPDQLLEDFVFYALTANPELAAASAQALMALGLTNAELAQVLDESERTNAERFDRAIARAQRIGALEDIAADLAGRIEQGRLDLARESRRIKEAIGMLTGTQRQRMLARTRLVTAGEYALPDLLREITEGQDERLKNQCGSVLEEIGRQAVTPLCEALLELGDQTSQRRVCDILGTIGWPHAAPTLKELSLSESASQPVREAAERALRSVVSRSADWTRPLPVMYTDLSRQYFNQAESLIAFPFEDTNNVWSYEWSAGLIATPVPTPIFGDVMAMQNAVRALKIDASSREALSLFVAANLDRENKLPPGQVDPIFGENQFTPDFYATVFGTSTCLDVLALAIDMVNTPLVRDAIEALSLTTGGGNLFSRDGGRQPLLEALQYPDRRAQYDAALTLALALPTERFSGDFAVVPLLASAVRTGNRTFALVIADDEEDQATLANMLDDQDFEVAGRGREVADLRAAIADAVGVDLVVVKKRSPEEGMRVISDLRIEPKTSAAPVLLQVGALDVRRMRDEYRADRRVLVGRTLGGDQFTAQVDSVLELASGGRMTEAEAEAYAIEALAALRDIAISGSPAYDITEAESALVDALEIRTGGTRMLVASILALIDTDRAQRELFDAALTANSSEQVDLLDRVASSVRRFGDHAEQRHVAALIDLIEKSAGETAEAAARVHGALNLAGSEAITKFLPKS